MTNAQKEKLRKNKKAVILIIIGIIFTTLSVYYRDIELRFRICSAVKNSYDKNTFEVHWCYVEKVEKNEDGTFKEASATARIKNKYINTKVKWRYRINDDFDVSTVQLLPY